MKTLKRNKTSKYFTNNSASSPLKNSSLFFMGLTFACLKTNIVYKLAYLKLNQSRILLIHVPGSGSAKQWRSTDPDPIAETKRETNFINVNQGDIVNKFLIIAW